MRRGDDHEIATSTDRSPYRTAIGLTVAALLLFAWTHRHALSLTGFADDLGLLADLPKLAAAGQLWPDVASRVVGPLWPQSTMWRPLPYASFALDASVWGAAAGGWHLTNLLLHLGCATLVGLLVRDLHRTLHRDAATLTGEAGASANASAALSFALFLLCPWSPEVTLWLVGRFDGWATLFVLLALRTGLRGGVSARSAIISLVAAALAYTSKESALILLPWLIVAVGLGHPWRDTAHTGAPAAWRQWGLFIAAHVLLATAYAAWRHYLFGGTAASVYGAQPVAPAWRWVQQVVAQLTFPAGLMPLAKTAAALSAGAATLLLMYGWRDHAVQRLRWLGLVMAASVLAALAFYLPRPPGGSEGYRLYYLSAAGLAIALGTLPQRVTALPIVAVIVLVLACGQWQSRVAAEWTHASRDMQAAASAIRTLASGLPANDYALLLLPDQQGHVPFARNAQGGVLALAQRMPAVDDATPIDLLSRLVIFTPPQLDEWQRLTGESVVRKLTSRPDAPANPTRYFCFDARTGTARDVGYWPPTPAPDWSSRWRNTVARQCPALLANWP